jgi:hypothetical protein
MRDAARVCVSQMTVRELGFASSRVADCQPAVSLAVAVKASRSAAREVMPSLGKMR